MAQHIAIQVRRYGLLLGMAFPNRHCSLNCNSESGRTNTSILDKYQGSKTPRTAESPGIHVRGFLQLCYLIVKQILNHLRLLTRDKEMLSHNLAIVSAHNSQHMRITKRRKIMCDVQGNIHSLKHRARR